MPDVYYALGLHMHQPPGNLALLIEHNEWEAQQIIRCYERAARYAHTYKDVARFHVGFSGILLEQFKDRRMIELYKRFVDIPRMIESYSKAKNIEIIGMGYYHPIFPLIPKEDWPEQLRRGRAIIKEMFGREPRGFWPSEMAFCMEMIPALREAGYEYVVVDHVHIQSLADRKMADCFQPYRARHEGSEIAVIPRNRDISNAQESGMDPRWLLHEVHHKVSSFPNADTTRLVTTWSDGENGGWFRQTDEAAGFFGHFFSPFMEKVRSGETEIRPVTISDFLSKHPPRDEAFVQTGAWNVASTSGYDFTQWAGTLSQKKAVEALCRTSRAYWQLKNQTGLSGERVKKMEEARELILGAETSCYLFWGDAWIPRIYDKLKAANELLQYYPS